MPDPSVLTPRGLAMLAMLPPQVRESPDYQGVIHAQAREVELLESKIEAVRAQLNPLTADELLLKAWEALLGLTVEPVGLTVAQRRTTIVAFLQRLKTSPFGSDWEENVTRLVGPGWTYAEHDGSDPSSPPPYTIRVQLPFAPTSRLYLLLERLLRDITPANLDIELQYVGGFILDESQLDQEGMHY